MASELVTALLAILAIVSIDSKIAQSSVLLKLVDTSECGIRRGCWKQPANCVSNDSGSNCDFIVSYALANDTATKTVDFVLQSQSLPADKTTWLAVGFSPDGNMPQSAVSVCIISPAGAEVILHFNPGFSTERITDRNLVFIFVKFAGRNGQEKEVVDLQIAGTLLQNHVCHFRQKVHPPSDSQIFDLSQQHFLLTAGGLADGKDWANPTMDFHTYKYATAGRVNLMAAGNETAPDETLHHKLVKAHGILMLIGWIVLAPTGIILARYFKKTFPQTETRETALWFDLHRLAQTAALLTVVAALTLVLVAADWSWVGLEKGVVTNHACFGLTAVIFIMFQPIFALFRCHPGTEFRPIFTWGHRIIGICAFLLSAAAIWEATQFYDVLNNETAQALVIGYWSTCFLTAVALEVQPLISRKVAERRTGAYRESTEEQDQKPTDDENRSVRICLLLFFGLSSIVVCSALGTLVATS